MRITDQVAHPRVGYRAKDFDEQAGHRFTIHVADDKTIETAVYLHWQAGKSVDLTVDMSCMSGCTRKCIFCAAARTRSEALNADQISRQVSLAIERVQPSRPDFFKAIKSEGRITFSFQGIGEPADLASEEVSEAIKRLRDEYRDWHAVQFSISSILDRVEPLAEWALLDLQTLQFSLHASTDAKRRRLLGASKTKPIATIFQALDKFKRDSSNTEIKINYVLIADENDSDEDREQLIRLLRDRPNFYLKISYLNETYPGLACGLRASQKYAEFFEACLSAHRNTYRYGAFQELQISCGQLASYAQPERADDSIRNGISELYNDIRSGRCTLFIGAGAAYTAWDAQGLARTLYNTLGRTTPFEKADWNLADVADAFEHIGRRREVDERIGLALRSAEVPGAMFDLPRYRWQAIYTTNYDEFVERAYATARSGGFAEQDCHVVLRPEDLQGLAPGAVPVVKLHGSISQGLRSVLSETDYLDGYVESIQLLMQRLAADIFLGSVLFVGYSFRDHFIKQWLFDLNRRLSHNRGGLWVVQPKSETSEYDRRRLQEQLSATLIPTDFAGLMRELESHRRQLVLMASGSKKQSVRGGADSDRSGAIGRIEDFCSELARGLDDRDIRLVTGATATDKVGYLIGKEMSKPRLVSTYTWAGAEHEPGNELKRMVRPTEVGGRPITVIERLLREAHALLLVGGGALTLREALTAMARGIPVIPVSIGGKFASDIVHSLFAGQYEAVGVLAADSGVDARFSEKVVEILSPERLSALQLHMHPVDKVATTVLDILDHVAVLDSQVYVKRTAP